MTDDKWMSLGKFPTELAENLYGETPDEQIGSVDDMGWFGLYVETNGGHVLSEDSNGFVSIETYETDLEMNDRWHEIEGYYAEWDNPDDEPEHVTDDIDFPRGATVLVHHHGGVAWTVEYVERMPNGDESVICHMVGDDRSEPFDRNDLTIHQDDVCRSCGQIGCEW